MQDYVLWSQREGFRTSAMPRNRGNDTVGNTDKEADTISAKQHC